MRRWQKATGGEAQGQGSGQLGGAEDEGGGLACDPGGWGAQGRGQQLWLNLPWGR